MLAPSISISSRDSLRSASTVSPGTKASGPVPAQIDEPPEEDDEFDLSKNEVYLKMKATPRSGNVGKAFLQIPTCVPASPDTATSYVVHEVRSSHAGTKRRILGVFRSRKNAEQKAAEARAAINSFLKRYNAWEFGEESHGGTMLTYYHLGNPLAIVGCAVYIEEAPMIEGSIHHANSQHSSRAN